MQFQGSGFVVPYGKKKYKPVAKKVKPIKAMLPSKFQIEQNIMENPLEGMPELPTNPPKYMLGVCYTEEQKKVIDENHPEGFLLPEEQKLLHCLLKLQEMAFAWEESEAGIFREDFFPQESLTNLYRS
ncbi:hypothetical protein Moror_2261 [Moniliophthora roreri MCA 2997]|uniref:Uncharacterized protein n=1 Tax=Moniliophthora roreri (strain MCA 2997) TaxID=1381753 RepID=V2WI11_MONRO|nr:hypothetical protein Moror_2261 [Moniliophthora roreri MCA 2997]